MRAVSSMCRLRAAPYAAAAYLFEVIKTTHPPSLTLARALSTNSTYASYCPDALAYSPANHAFDSGLILLLRMYGGLPIIPSNSPENLRSHGNGLASTLGGTPVPISEFPKRTVSWTLGSRRSRPTSHRNRFSRALSTAVRSRSTPNTFSSMDLTVMRLSMAPWGAPTEIGPSPAAFSHLAPAMALTQRTRNVPDPHDGSHTRIVSGSCPPSTRYRTSTSTIKPTMLLGV